MLDAACPWQVLAVLDWELCTIGDPLSGDCPCQAVCAHLDQPAYRRRYLWAMTVTLTVPVPVTVTATVTVTVTAQIDW